MNAQALNATFLLLIVFMTFVVANSLAHDWPVGFDFFLNKCSPPLTNTKSQKPRLLDFLRSCLRRRALMAMNSLVSTDVIPIYDGLDLVRFEKDNATIDKSNHKYSTSDARDSGKSWREIVFERVAQIFKTHVLKIDIDKLTGVSDSISRTTRNNGDETIIEGRRRHRRRNQMMPMLMMGALVMGSVLIPMGFQFLAVLGGKALILAKLALMLSSIQGLKKIATNGVNYGLYHTPVSEGWHDRSHHEPPVNGHYEVPYQMYSRI